MKCKDPRKYNPKTINVMNKNTKERLIHFWKV